MNMRGHIKRGSGKRGTRMCEKRVSSFNVTFSFNQVHSYKRIFVPVANIFFAFSDVLSVSNY